MPVGTEYHWYILAHQHVRKLNANSYATTLTGLKYKLAHKRFDKQKWNVTDANQRKRLVKLLKQILSGLEKDWVDTRAAAIKSTLPLHGKKILASAKTKLQQTRRLRVDKKG